MVGNLHEWVADPSGTFYGGYYQDVSSKGHGEGCGYLTTAHEARYHDYSTGFRCCADVAGGAPVAAAPAPPAALAESPSIQALSCWPTCRWTHYDLTMVKPGRVEGLKFVHRNDRREVRRAVGLHVPGRARARLPADRR